jgi:predicted RNA-binding protein with PUA-like domain
MNYWLIKSEPDAFSLADFVTEKTTVWNGVRNYTARNYLKTMQLGDMCLFYRSVVKPAVVATCRVVKEFYQDPTTDLTAWVAVEVELVDIFEKEVSLSVIKQTPELQNMLLLKMSRLSVQPVTLAEWAVIQKLSLISK